MARNNKSSSKLDRNLRRTLSAILPQKLLNIYMSRLKHWIKFKGKEYTAKRLKTLWNCAQLLRCGSADQIPNLCKEARIKCRHGLPVGIEGVLIKRFSLVNRPSTIRRASVPFRVYTSLYLESSSKAQIEKARKAINDPGIQPIKLIDHYEQKESIESLYNTGWTGIFLLCPITVPSDWQPNLKLPHLGQMHGTSVYPSFHDRDLTSLSTNYRKSLSEKSEKKVKNKWKKLDYDTHFYPFLHMMASMVTKGRVPTSLIDRLGDNALRQYAEDLFGWKHELPFQTFGKISVIQESGAKGRVVCTPNAWVQYYCKPYHEYLSGLIMRLEGDTSYLRYVYGTSAMFNQVRGVDLALRNLDSGRFCAAVDLSSATDRFPLFIQQSVCRDLGIPEFATALEELKGPYDAPDGGIWTYNCGQPMGIYGSFPLFHLTHYMLLNGMCHKLGLENDGTNFSVLGDDVLIFNEILYQTYISTLDKLQVPISWHKSFIGKLVEFAGFIITKTKTSWTAYRPYKFGRDGSFSSVPNVLHALGDKVKTWNDKYWSKALQLYNRTSTMRNMDLSPLVKEDDVSFRLGKQELPTGHWFGSLLQKIAQLEVWMSDSNGQSMLTLHDDVGLAEAWTKSRYDLCQTQISPFDHQFYGKPQPSDRLVEPSNFDPKTFREKEWQNKRLWRNFYNDPLIREAAEALA